MHIVDDEATLEVAPVAPVDAPPPAPLPSAEPGVHDGATTIYASPRQPNQKRRVTLK